MLPYRYPGGHHSGQKGVETEEGKTAQTALMAGNQNRQTLGSREFSCQWETISKISLMLPESQELVIYEPCLTEYNYLQLKLDTLKRSQLMININ